MSKPSLYIIRQDRSGTPRYIASALDELDCPDVADQFAWTDDRDSALALSRSTARRLAAVVAVENGRAAMVLPMERMQNDGCRPADA